MIDPIRSSFKFQVSRFKFQLKGLSTSMIDPKAWRPEYDSYQSWQAINETSMYTAGGLLLTSVVMSFFTDWAGHDDEDE